MAADLRCAAAPANRWRIGRYEWERYSRTQAGTGSRGRWGCRYRNMCGVSNYRTPIGAFFALQRWMRQPALPTEG